MAIFEWKFLATNQMPQHFSLSTLNSCRRVINQSLWRKIQRQCVTFLIAGNDFEIFHARHHLPSRTFGNTTICVPFDFQKRQKSTIKDAATSELNESRRKKNCNHQENKININIIFKIYFVSTDSSFQRDLASYRIDARFHVIPCLLVRFKHLI